jgi:uncharacterized protein
MAAAGDRSPLFVAWRERRFTLVISDEMMAELQDVVTRPELLRFLPQQRSERLIELLWSRAVFVEPVIEHPRCRDPKDDKVIATALAGGADFLVTADKDLYDDTLLVRELDGLGIRIVQRDEFLRSL